MTPFRSFQTSADRYQTRPFLCLEPATAAAYGEPAREWTYAEGLAEMQTLADAYRTQGYGRGHRVGLMLDNRPAFFWHFLALSSLGASIVPVHADLTPRERAYLVGHSDMILLVAHDKHMSAARCAIDECGRAVGLHSTHSGAAFPKASNAPLPGGAEPSDEAALLYTSGTTGRPKGCMLSNEYFTALGAWYVDEGGHCALKPGQDRLITPLPVSHMNALAVSTMAMIMSGGCVIQLDRFHPTSWWESVRTSRATVLHYLGVMPAMLLNAPQRPDDDFSRQIRFGFGAGVDPKHHVTFEERFGFPLIEAWAMTETGAGGCIAASVEPRHRGTRCFGKKREHTMIRLVDEQSRDVGEGEPGELLIRTAGAEPRRHFFSGYYKDAKATDEAWEGGWFHTGDVVKRDADGSYYFVDRRKNVIRRSGENIAAVEVESVLLQLPQVAGCAVAPVADEVRGEEVMALVVLQPGLEPNESVASAISRDAGRQLAYFKTPGYISFIEDLPKTASQKVQRGEVRRICVSLLGSAKAFDLRKLKKKPRDGA